MIKIEADTVAIVLTKVARGELAATTTHHGACLWTVRAGGLEIDIFDDAHEVDYVERVVDEAGRTVRFEQYMNAHGFDPIDLLAPEDRKKLSMMMFGDYLEANRPSRRRPRHR